MSNSMTALSAERPSSAIDPKTHVEKVTPTLPSEIYLLSPGDVHLAANNRSGALFEILSRVECRILVLNGDFLETSSLRHLLRHLTQRDRDLIRLIEGKRRAGMRIVYTLGNHDEGVPALLAQIAGLTGDALRAYTTDERDILETLSLIQNWEIHKWFVHEHGGMKFIHIHGDQWDHIVRGKRMGKLLAYTGSFFWDILKRIDQEKHQIASFTKRRVKLVTKVSDQVAHGAVELAKQQGAHYVFAGHTHDPCEFHADGITYVNVGGFDMYESGLASIDTDGNVLLHRVQARSKQIENPHYQA